MKSTKIEKKCKDCKEYKDCKERDGQGRCSIKVWIMVANQLLGN